MSKKMMWLGGITIVAIGGLSFFGGFSFINISIWPQQESAVSTDTKKGDVAVSNEIQSDEIAINTIEPTFSATSTPDDYIEVTGSQIIGELKFENQTIKYKYAANITGNYRFDFDIDNVNNNYKFAVIDSKGTTLRNSSCDIKGITVELVAGNTYTIIISQYKGYPKYTIDIGSPNTIRDIEGNRIVGSINYIDQEDNYKYTAPISGIYGLKFEISDVQQYYGYSIYDSKNAKVKSGNSDLRQASVELNAGETYSVKITQKKGFINYTVILGVPNDVTYVNNNSINGNITYYNQENCYIFVPSYTKAYVFKMGINDVRQLYKVKVIDDVNATVKTTNSGNKECKVDLVAGKTYKIYVSYCQGECSYSISIL